jgi:hypothetical protein
VDTQHRQEDAMPARVPLYQEVEAEIKRVTAAAGLRATAARRLALLVAGILAARSAVIAQVAAELFALGVTGAGCAESVARRLRRALADARLEPTTCYAPVLATAIDWGAARGAGGFVVLAADESSRGGALHLFRVSLAYRGGSLPLAWATWPQNQPLGAGRYWAEVDAVLARVAAVLPPGLAVAVVADRAYDVPAFVDRVAAHGWRWVVRCKAHGAMRFRDRAGREQAVGELTRRWLPRAGRRWKGRGRVFKEAGWREASLVGLWGRGHREPLVVLSDLPAQWRVLRLYRRRFWIEAGFRSDKARGWQWEQSQVRDPAHQERLLLALAWASLVALCLGAQAAEAKLVARRARALPPRRRPEHARESLFTLGLQRARQWLYRPAAAALRWHLPDPLAERWADQWRRAQGHFAHTATVRP